MSKNECPHLPKPLQLPITYHRVSDDAVAFAWGVDVRLGTPAQSFSLIPSLFDFTSVANSSDCGSPPDSFCAATLGGIYEESLSTTQLKTASTPWKNDWNGSIDFGDALQYALYNDVLTFGENDLAIPGFPFATDGHSQMGKTYFYIPGPIRLHTDAK